MRQYKCNKKTPNIHMHTDNHDFFCNNKNHNKTNILQAQKSLSSFIF